MVIYGDKKIVGAYVGSTPLKAIYVGNVKVYPSEEEPYLRVTPEGTQWLQPNENLIYLIESNTDWKVV